MFGGKHDSLKMQCLEDVDCTPEKAKDMLLTALGKVATPSNKSTDAHIYAGNGNITGDAIRQGLYSRLGHERAERGNPYAMMSLFEMAQASLVDRWQFKYQRLWQPLANCESGLYAQYQRLFPYALLVALRNLYLQAGKKAVKLSSSGRKPARYPTSMKPSALG